MCVCVCPACFRLHTHTHTCTDVEVGNILMSTAKGEIENTLKRLALSAALRSQAKSRHERGAARDRVHDGKALYPQREVHPI